MSSELQMVMQALKELDHDMKSLNQKMDGLTKRMDRLDQKMDGLAGRMGGLDQRMDTLEQSAKSEMAGLRQDMEDKHFDILDKIDIMREQAFHTEQEVKRMKRKVGLN
ncbi:MULTISPECIES: hypothetical protein [unclassified Sporolactobacillus]|uniref:hypothetical protein n=1 Tax=unclassified Sporolactobacillus TaxID=2628533 RepID=UPI002367E886|nr:hypothetical protein [Sporolactobacillus sp. CQH2019]MDD9149707.1 hypothetical protein [Sporolactobacillus sp. CQH2019]